MQLARQDMIGRGWSQGTVESLVPAAEVGKAGLRATKNYVMIQNKGFKPFVMWWVKDRVVPIHDKDGSVHLVKGKEPGQPGFVTLPGGVRKWRDQKWRHPGLEPKNFIENALTQAIAEYRHPLRTKFLALFKRIGEKFK